LRRSRLSLDAVTVLGQIRVGLSKISGRTTPPAARGAIARLTPVRTRRRRAKTAIERKFVPLRPFPQHAGQGFAHRIAGFISLHPGVVPEGFCAGLQASVSASQQPIATRGIDANVEQYPHAQPWIKESL
jgi:hypothetical protein